MPRDRRFIAVHRGGPLALEHHRHLANWAADCAEHVLFLFSSNYTDDNRPWVAIETARAWARGEVKTGVAQKASVAAHAAARAAKSLAAREAARAAGHAVATAHAADHALGGAAYALRALRAAGDGEEALAEERKWQRARLPQTVRDLVLSATLNMPQLWR